MAEWNSFTISPAGPIQDIAKQAQTGISTIQGALEVVKTGAEVAKLFISGVLSPQLVIITAVADELIKVLSDYKELGFYALIINPLDENYGAKKSAEYGLEMKRDDNGYILFKPIVVRNPSSEFDGFGFRVPENYRQNVNLDNLSYNEYKDRMGRGKGDPGFTPPIPEIVYPPKFVLGGYDPATWTGTLEDTDDFPSLPAPECIRLMADSLDDEGDIPKYEIINKTETFSKGPFTESGAAISTYDPLQLYRVPLYRSSDTNLPTSDRGLITKQVKSGKPGYQGSEGEEGLFSGVKISALALVVAAPDPEQFLSTLESLNSFLGKGLPELKELELAFKDIFQPDPVSLTVEVNSGYGLFQVGDIIKGFDSGAVGKISKIVETKQSQRIRTTYKFIKNDFGDITQIQKVSFDTNENGVWQNMKLEYTPLGDPTNRFAPNEKVYEAKAVTRTGSDGKPRIEYVIKGLANKGSLVAQNGTAAPVLPKYGIAKGINAIAPNSVAPDFFSIKASQMFPGWSDFFDGLIELANGIKGFAEDSSAFIDALIEAIDDLVEFFEDLVAKITEFLELFSITLPSAGIYALPITTSGGNDAIKEALSSSDNAPPNDLKLSAGVLLMSTEINGIDPLVTLGGVLGLEFQSV